MIPSASTGDIPAGLPCPDSTASFWLSEPSQFLLGHRTTPDLPPSADVVIVGTGITGASAARFLAEDSRARKKKIVLLEAREVCWGATGRNGGHCQPLLFDRTPEVAAFEVKNVTNVREYVQKYGVPCEFRSLTACRTFWTEATLKVAEEEIAKLKQTDPLLAESVKVVKDAKGLKQHRVKTHATGLTLTEGASSLWPYKYVAFIVEKLVKDGVINLQTNTPVTSMVPGPSKHFTTLHTPRGSMRAKHVILATNGYTSHVLPSFSSLVVPVRCEMSALHPPVDSSRLENSYGFVGAKDQCDTFDDYLIQRPFYESPNGDGFRRGGHLMFGGGRGQAKYKCVGITDDDVVDEGEASYLRRTLLDLLELGGDADGLDELKASHQWTGIKGYSRDGMPWVGKVPNEGSVWLCGGYTGHGMPNATLSAKAVVDMILGEEEGVEYEATCEHLVKNGNLPRPYIITAERIENAKKFPTVAKQEEDAVLKHQSERLAQEKEGKGRSCITM